MNTPAVATLNVRLAVTVVLVSSVTFGAVTSCDDESSTAPQPTPDASILLDAGAGADGARDGAAVDSAASDSAATDSGATDSGSTDSAAPDDASAVTDADAGTDGGCNNAELAHASFKLCEDGGVQVGQKEYAPGITCAEVCCAFGFPGCAHRAGQSGLSACSSNGSQTGTCADVFQSLWSSACICVK